MDRIHEAYMGGMGAEFQRKTRLRLHWICEQVCAGSVLDIGCSQGIGSILMGRSGFSVTGVDVNPEAIEYANDLLEKEQDTVKKRVQFLNCDFIDYDTDGTRYDNIVFGEVLEHLIRPDLFLEKAWTLLNDQGRIIVTVPFGINDDPDHRQTFYYSKLYHMIHRFFTVDSVKVFGKWIGFVGTRRSSFCDEPANITNADFEYIEENFYTVERSLVDTNNWYISQKAKLEKELSAIKTQQETTVTQLNRLIQENAVQSNELSTEKAKSQQLMSELSEEKARGKQLTSELSEEKARGEQLTSELSEEKARGEQLTSELSAEKARGEQLTSELSEEKARGEQLTSELSKEKSRGKQLTSELSEEKARGEQLTSELSVEKARGEQLTSELSEEKLKGEQLTNELIEEKANCEEISAEAELLRRNAERYEANLQRKAKELMQLHEQMEHANNLAKEDQQQAQLKIQMLQQEVDKAQGTLKTNEETVQSHQKTIQNQRQQISNAEKQLVAANIQLRNTERKLSLATYNYELLAKSKLGRFTLWYWKRKDAVLFQFRKGDPNAKTIRNFSKKIPGLRPFVLWLRRVRGISIIDAPVKAKPKSVPVPQATAPATAPAAVSASAPAPTPAKPAVVNKLTHGDETYFERIKDKIANMPESNGGRYYRRVEKKIGIICDQFYYDSVYAAADFVYISPDNWEEKLKAVELLLVVSTWHGLHNEEWRGVAFEGRPTRNLVYEIIEYCNAERITTVFYSKEDPTHYKNFLGIAEKCDYVFTTAEEVIPDYKRDCGHERIYSLRFGINPVFHNPVGMCHAAKERAVVFSGTWMAVEDERCKDLAMIFDGVLDSGKNLQIIDRMYKSHTDKAYQFPDKYFQYAAPSIDHDDLQKVHKLYNWSININTVKLSQTMFANRVYELQAAGNLLISNYSMGINNLLPTVFLVHDSEEVGHILNGFTPEEIYERQMSGVRAVMTGETCYDRIAEMLSKVGISRSVSNRKVLVVANILNDRITEMFEQQSYKDKILISEDKLTNKIMSQYDIIAFFRDDNEYGVFYLEDMVNGFKYTDCDYITKSAYLKDGQLNPGVEHDYVDIMGSKYRTVFWADAFTAGRLKQLGEGVQIINGYSIDHFNYSEGTKKNKPNEKYKLSVILPIYNVGWALYGKAFASLRRSSMFHQMEILLVDDGSTDGFTPKMVKYLESLYPNVRTYFFNDGGSGSAARPRNKGIELATTDYILFFDPDDEVVHDTHAKLYQMAVEGSHDLVTSNRFQISDEEKTFNYYNYLKSVCGKDRLIDNGGSYLRKTDFVPVGIQGMIIKKSLIEENKLKQIEGAIGEDTLFSWQLLTVARDIKATALLSHVYYAARVGSVVNSIGKSFFQKYIKCEQACVKWLNESALMNDYMEKAFVRYAKYRYIEKLAKVKNAEGEESAKILYRVLSNYLEYYDRGDETVNCFLDLCERGDYLGAYWMARDIFSPADCNTAPDEGFYARIESQVKAIPKSNGGRYYIPWDYRVGVISDDFLYNSYKDVADCVPLSPDNWEKEIDSLDLFLLITGWKGIDQEWKNCAAEGSPSRNLIYKIIDTCNEKGIPTVFYSIEDPPEYALFLNIAKHCQYVFTTAEEIIPNYKRDCGHDRVQAIRFGMNPLFHNPVGMKSFAKINEVIFSGAWYEKYPERCRDTEMIFDGVLRSNARLRVINRNFYNSNPRYKFPERFQGYTSPAIAHEDLQKVHKLFNWAINTNSVRESYTMFANRVYELQAAGNILLSNNSPGVNKWLPTVHLIQNSNEIPRILNAYTDEQIYERQITDIRFCMTGESSFDRFAQILGVLKLNSNVTTRTVAVIADHITPEIKAMFAYQSLQGCGLFEESSVTENDLLSFDIVAFWNHKAHYEEFYLEDMVNAFKYTDCDYITKDAFMKAGQLVIGKEHDFVAFMNDKYRSVFWKTSYSLKELLALTTGELSNGYSIDHFNYDAEPVAQISEKREYKLSVIIPVHNNGKHLYGKALASLMRSRVFKDLEIIMVDGASDDGYTDKLQSWMCRRYPNLRMETIPYSGKDFLKHARAAGVKAATASYVAFLNPENEVLTDAYASLLEWAHEDDVDAVMGNLYHFELCNKPCVCTEKAVVLKQSKKIADALCRAGTSGEMQNFIVRRKLLTGERDFGSASACLNQVKRLSLRPIDMLVVYH